MNSLERLEAHCRLSDYKGFCKFDALNSPWIENTFGNTAIARLVATQLVNRTPLPLREWLGVSQERNPKGIGNFLRAYALMGRTKETKELADWLLENDSGHLGAYDGPGRAWGYHFPWQSPGFFAPRHFPNCIVTVFCAEGLLDAYQLTKDRRYLEAAEETLPYLLGTLPVLESTPETLCIGYVHEGLKWKVININAVTAGFLSRLSRYPLGNEKSAMPLETARKMIEWVVRARTSGEGEGPYWNYTVPYEQSRIGPDNYHTGGILDGIWDTMEVSGDRKHEDIYLSAVKFYDQRFFTSKGGPKWRARRIYPMDIHGAAQGILTFVRASKLDPSFLERAHQIANWAITEMQDPDKGFFYFQKYRFFTWRIDLMRWSGSWMMWALAALEDATRGGEK